MNHRNWDKDTVKFMLFADVEAEHNALYADWKQSSLEAERLAKVNGDLCDRLEEERHHISEVMDENNRLGREFDEARQALAPIRVPFSDAVIEKMAQAACDGWGSGDYSGLYKRDALHQHAWHNAIRAALADEVDARDAVITKLLDAIKPTDEDDRLREFSNAACDRYGIKQRLYNRALQIAGRKSDA